MKVLLLYAKIVEYWLFHVQLKIHVKNQVNTNLLTMA